MRLRHLRVLLAPAAAAMLLIAACTKYIAPSAPNQNAATQRSIQQQSITPTTGVTQILLETFESGSKTAYAAGTVTFPTGAWTLTDALVGTSASDAKDGSQSIRVRNTGIISMDFDVSS